MREYRRPAMPKELYKGFYLVKDAGLIFIYDIAGGFYGTAQTKEEAVRAIDRRAARRGIRQPNKNPQEKLLPFHSGKRPGYQNINRAYLKKLGLKPDMIDRMIQRQLNGATLKDAYYAETKYHPNPLTRAEASNIRAEAAIHKRIATMSQRPIKKAYYQGMGAGMIDTAEQYAENPKHGPTFRTRMWNLVLHSPEIFSTVEKQSIRESYLSRGKKSFTIEDAHVINKFFSDYLASNWHPEKIRHNPPRVEVYENLKEVIAVKGPGHKCDAACRRARHTYRHKFTSRPRVFGNPDGSLTIK